MKKTMLLIATLLSFNSFAHCPIAFTEADLCADISWIDGPNLGTTSHFEIVFWEKGDHSHTYITPSYDLKMYTWMVMDNGMNHGGPAITFNQVDDGVYEVMDARFFMHGMKGHWEVRIELGNQSGLVSLGKTVVPLEGN